jgi:hypothetical protein
MTVLVIRAPILSLADRAAPCNRANTAHSSDAVTVASPLRPHLLEGRTMVMFNRSQLYIGLALAGLFQIIVRVATY